MKLTITTTYIGMDGNVKDVKKTIRRLYYQTVLSQTKQSATIKEYESGYKITVSKLEPDKD